MSTPKGMNYRDAGVLAGEELGLGALLKWIRPTEEFRSGRRTGRSLLDVGYFANVIDLGGGMGLALSTDGVGTKVLVAEMLDRYDTIGIDCVAMNVNDIICVGAEPVSMLDYIAIERVTPGVLEAIGRGLHEGARRAGVNIVGGEISQIREMIRGHKEGSGLDLVGMCVGVVPVGEINVGQNVVSGDVIVGLRSSGVHSNGLTLARSALFERGSLRPDSRVSDLGQSVGEELLEPTRIYVSEVMELLSSKVPVKALVNITGDGLFNLTRVKAAVGFRIDRLPEPQPIFRLIQETGGIGDDEMYRVFNMGVGFCVIAPNDRVVLERIHDTMRRHDVESFEIGAVVEDPERRIHLPRLNLIGQGGRFFRST